MTLLCGLLVLAALACGSLAAAELLDKDPALLALPVLAGSVIWLCLGGMAGLLLPAAWLWLAAMAGLTVFAALGAGLPALMRRAQSPAFGLFVAGSLAFWLLFAVRQPLFTQWDEFTLWGSACKMVCEQDVLFPAARGYLAGRGSLPGMMLLSYLFQFAAPGFAEWAVFAAYDTLYMAVAALAASLAGRGWRSAVLAFAAVVSLPFFFSVYQPGAVSQVYQSAMGDLALAFVFGGAVCLYLAAGDSPAGLAGCGLVLVFLTLIKDIGLAYALVAVLVMALARAFGQKPVRLRRVFTTAGLALVAAVLIAGAFVLWSVYVMQASGVDKNAVGGEGESVGYATVLLGGLAQLLGIGRTEKFSAILALMLKAPFTLPVCLLGPGVVAMAAALVAQGAAAFCAAPGAARRRVLWISAGLWIGLAAFWVFHLFLYVYNFADIEAYQLKDYARYLGSVHIGMTLASLGLLALACREEKGRAALARLGVCGAAAALVAVCLWRGPRTGFWNYPSSLYDARQEIKARAATVNDYLDWDDEVLLICQGDDVSRWYYYGYELHATIANGFGGTSFGDARDNRWPTTGMTLLPYFSDANEFETVCSRDGLVAFLQEAEYDYILVDWTDEYFCEEFSSLFDAPIPLGTTHDPLLFKIEDGGAHMTLVAGGDEA